MCPRVPAPSPRTGVGPPRRSSGTATASATGADRAVPRETPTRVVSKPGTPGPQASRDVGGARTGTPTLFSPSVRPLGPESGCGTNRDEWTIVGARGVSGVASGPTPVGPVGGGTTTLKRPVSPSRVPVPEASRVTFRVPTPDVGPQGVRPSVAPHTGTTVLPRPSFSGPIPLTPETSGGDQGPLGSSGVGLRGST